MAHSAPGARVGGSGDALFDPQPDRLGPRLHRELFGALPARTARALDAPEVAAAVRPLLDAGWRPAQLAARVGALPAAPDEEQAVLAVTTFLGQLLARDSPQQAWERERGAREAAASVARAQALPVASEATRERWAGQVRRELGLRPRVLRVPAPREAPGCASCGAGSHYFVTREVRLCEACVALLATGEARLVRRAREAG